MEENKAPEPQTDNSEPRVESASENQTEPSAETLKKLSAEVEMLKASVQKRKSENTTLRVLFYTALVVLLGGFLYSNSVLQRAHMRSLERNIISLENRMTGELDGVKQDLHSDLESLHERVQTIYRNDLFTTLDRMDEAITQMDPKDERTAMLINRVRLHADELNRAIRDQLSRSKVSEKKGGNP
ncbi:hypothetical protein UZ36_05085 [Candidatus Nitromaritima sp. SCGC AAA799-C22]|nr:hypothetical protein UZ36_05085 [Candidatus Nitromaritima sp. SCGC AAA799-C22]